MKNDPVKAELLARKTELLEKTAAFCRAHLNEEYATLCRKLIEKMARKRNNPFARGSLDIWAAGIVHALGSANFLFDASTTPHVRATEIAEYFDVRPGSAAQKAAAIRDLMRLDSFDHEFATAATREHQTRLKNIMVQTINALLPDAPPELILSEMPHFGARPPRDVEFVDDDHAVMDNFYELAEQYERSGATPALQQKLRNLIRRDADFFDPYLMLADILSDEDKDDEADALLNEAYTRALRRVIDRKGNWPQRMEWGWLENRHLLRTFINQAMALWDNGDNEGALEIFRKLLACDPNDNTGARNYILAIRLGLSLDEFEDKFNRGGYYDSKLFDWFDKYSKQFPDEFAAWKHAMEEEE